ncbi:MAG: hypothetical protein J0H15_12225 [Xanthomonadales bacterium]|nr:hypothetical protein [Xanthomonadales bacterium]
MSYVVISSFENTASGDLQAEGEAVTVWPNEAAARAHFDKRERELAAAANAAREVDSGASFVTWLLILGMPLEVGSVEEALEDLELVLEETEAVDDPFGELVLAYEGRAYAPDRVDEYPRKLALEALEAWLT